MARPTPLPHPLECMQRQAKARLEYCFLYNIDSPARHPLVSMNDSWNHRAASPICSPSRITRESRNSQSLDWRDKQKPCICSLFDTTPSSRCSANLCPCYREIPSTVKRVSDGPPPRPFACQDGQVVFASCRWPDCLGSRKPP